MLLSNMELIATAPGGIAKLRELILTLAVQGKLVPQNPADEPAGVLLKKIRAEKDRLVAEGKIKRDKPLAEIAEEEKPFELPVGWEWARLADVVRVLNGRAYNKQELLEVGPVPVLRVGNLFTSNHWYYSDLQLEPDKYCEQGDLLYAWSASFGPFVWEGPKAIYHYHIWKLQPWNPSFFNTGFFHKFLAEKTAEIKAAGHGVSMVHMTKEKMEKIVVPYPPLAEQSRIVTRVEALMRLCDALEAKGRLEAAQHAQLVSTLLGTLTASTTPEELADNWQRVATHFDLLLDRPEAIDALEQTILQLAVRGLLVPQDPKDEPASVLLQKIRVEKDRLIAEGKLKKDKLAEPLTKEDGPAWLPSSWGWMSLSELHPEFQNGASSRGDAGGTMVTVLRLADIKNRRVSLADTREIPIAARDIEKYQVSHGDILITRVNGSADIVGQFNLCDADYDAIYCDHFIRMRINGGWMDRMFLALLGESDLVRARIKDLFITTAGQKTVNQGHIGSLPLPLPPLAEQSRIVARVESLRRLCAHLRQRLSERQSVQARLAEALVQQAAFA